VSISNCKQRLDKLRGSGRELKGNKERGGEGRQTCYAVSKQFTGDDLEWHSFGC
jgi:hypothetical protein